MKEALKLGGGVIIVIALLSGLAGLFGWFGDAADAAKKEFGPKAMLTKYEWFIDTSKQIERMQADITIYQVKQEICVVPKGMYKADRIEREQCMLWAQEVAGIKSSYNDIVAEYNSASSKFNWSMFDTANIPTSYQRR